MTMKMSSVYISSTYNRERPYSINCSFANDQGMNASFKVDDETTDKIMNILREYGEKQFPEMGKQIAEVVVEKPIALPAPDSPDVIEAEFKEVIEEDIKKVRPSADLEWDQF